MTLIEEEPLGELQDPVLIAGFVTHRRAGRIGSRAAAYLVSQWHGKLVARIDSEDYLDLTVDRPEARWVDDLRTVKWPDTLLYRARPRGSDRDFILLVGFEPNVRWQAFAEELTAYADAAGVKTLLSIRGFPASVPHTRPAPVRISASDDDLASQFGLQERLQRYEGATDILGVLAAYGQQKDWRTVDMTILQPTYYPRMRNAAATMAVVGLLDKAFGTTTSTEPLVAASKQQMAELEKQTPPGDEFASMVRGLEQLYDEAKGNAEFIAAPGDSDLPSGEEVVSEIERLLRGQGEDPE